MLATVYSAGSNLLDGFFVTMECHISTAVPDFEIVGMPGVAVKEARERIKAAMENSGCLFPESAVIINMAPAYIKKEGSSYDLPALIAILAASGQISGGNRLEGKCFIGELSLSGEIRPVHGVLGMCLAARAEKMNEIFVPAENAAEAAVIDGITVYGAESISQLVSHLKGTKLIAPYVFDRAAYEHAQRRTVFDLCDVRGQYKARRALEIAAAGGHNVLLIGPPGTGKSMLAKRMPSILPEMSFEEALETSKVYSGMGLLDEKMPLILNRPFRSPHHGISSAALVGGGKNIIMPGEISLSHNGVLFLDELPEFKRDVMEAMRQPIEDGQVTISRASGRSATFPAKFSLIAAMNPCPCGYFGSMVRECTCTPIQRKSYLAKISGPLLDRFDIQIEMGAVPYKELSAKSKPENSENVRTRVQNAKNFAKERFAQAGVYCNAQLTPAHIRRFCLLDDSCEALLSTIFERLKLSPRGYDRIIRMSRTIADLAQSPQIKTEHIAEAVQLRTLDRDYWQR